MDADSSPPQNASADNPMGYEDLPLPDRPYYIVTLSQGKWLNNRLHVASDGTVKISGEAADPKRDWWEFPGINHIGRLANTRIKNVGTGEYLDFGPDQYVYMSGAEQETFYVWYLLSGGPCQASGSGVHLLSCTSTQDFIGVTDASDRVLKNVQITDKCETVWRIVEVPAGAEKGAS